MKKFMLSLLIVFTLIGIMVPTVQAEWIYGKTLKSGNTLNYYHHENGEITEYIIIDGVKTYHMMTTTGFSFSFGGFPNGDIVYSGIYFKGKYKGATEKGIHTTNGTHFYKKIFKGLVAKGIKKNGIDKGVVFYPDGSKKPYKYTDN